MKTLAVGLLRDALRRNRKNEIVKMLTTLSVVMLLGIGVAAAAIEIVPAAMIDPAMRPLSATPGLIVSPAQGLDDEDCTIATRPLTLPNGYLRLDREQVCEQ